LFSSFSPVEPGLKAGNLSTGSIQNEGTKTNVLSFSPSPEGYTYSGKS